MLTAPVDLLCRALVTACAIGLAVLFGNNVLAAELITLSPENYAEYVPKGKEVDAIYGDYVLRNEHIIAVVADPAIHRGRSASRKGGISLPGCLIDLASRDNPNDLLEVFDASFVAPMARGNQVAAGDPGEPHQQGHFKDEATYHTLPGRQPKRGKRVVLTIPFEGQCGEIRYVLEDDWRHIRVESDLTRVVKGRRRSPVKVFDPATMISLGKGDLKRQRRFLYGGADDFSWVYDPWFGQAYGVVTQSHPTIRHIPNNRKHYLIQKAAMPLKRDVKALTTVSLVFPAPDAFAASHTAANLGNSAIRTCQLTVTDPSGPVAGALVKVVLDRATLYAAGRTAADGTVALALPTGPARITIGSSAHPNQTETIEPGQTERTIQLPAAGTLRIRITDGANQPIPSKVELRGRGTTPTPHFGPDEGTHGVRNLIYTVDGQFTQAIRPGDYTAIISHGPEFQVVRQDVTVTAGDETTLAARLKRVVNSTGWVSCDFGNRSTLSRATSTASTKGRVLNLLAENIEFAPSGERDFVSSYQPIIDELGVQAEIASCPGIGLTERARKTVTSQNCFPVRHRLGAQDGGALQRSQHVFQVFWLNGWYGKLPVGTNSSYIGATEKLIQVTPPGIWENDGRWHGMWMLFSDETMLHSSLRKGFYSTHRNNRMNHLRCFHAMEVQPLQTFLKLPDYDPEDPAGLNDLEAWQLEMDEWSRTKKWPKLKSPNREWLRMLNMGWRITGVVNGNAYHNYHGSGRVRTYVRNGSATPGDIDPLDIVRAVKAGQAVMTTGPFLDVRVGNARPGDDVQLAGGSGTVHVRVQCNNAMDIDTVKVLLNGRPVPEMTRTRAEHPQLFNAAADSTVRFDHELPLKCTVDSRVMVLVSGTGENIHGVMVPQNPAARKKRTKREWVTSLPHVALSNPIYVDIDGDGFKPHPPWQDRVYTRMLARTPLLSTAGAAPATATLDIKNVGTKRAQDSFSLFIRPAGAATVVGENRYRYDLAPGEMTTIKFKLAYNPESKVKRLRVAARRSSAGVGRRPAGVVFVVDRTKLPKFDNIKNASHWWLPEHDKQRPPHWLWKEHGR